MRKPRVYVAGPLSQGNWMDNIRHALDIAEFLRGHGVVPVIPHLSAFDHLVHPQKHREWLAEDFSHLATCDALVRLPGESPGSEKEWDEARRLALPCFAWDGSDSVSAFLGWLDQWEPEDPAERTIGDVMAGLAKDVELLKTQRMLDGDRYRQGLAHGKEDGKKDADLDASAQPDAGRGVFLIAQERRKQLEKWGTDHDVRTHNRGELIEAVLCLAQGIQRHRAPSWAGMLLDKHDGDRIRQLQIAGALIAAEIDRIEGVACLPF